MAFFPSTAVLVWRNKNYIKKLEKSYTQQGWGGRISIQVILFSYYFLWSPKLTNKSFREGQITHPMKNTCTQKDVPSTVFAKRFFIISVILP